MARRPVQNFGSGIEKSKKIFPGNFLRSVVFVVMHGRSRYSSYLFTFHTVYRNHRGEPFLFNGRRNLFFSWLWLAVDNSMPEQPGNSLQRTFHSFRAETNRRNPRNCFRSQSLSVIQPEDSPVARSDCFRI